MSKQALEKFRGKLAGDQAFRSELARVLSGRASDSVNELLAFAQARGFELTADEARSAMELTERDLDGVAGGARPPVHKIQDSED